MKKKIKDITVEELLKMPTLLYNLCHVKNIDIERIVDLSHEKTKNDKIHAKSKKVA